MTLEFEQLMGEVELMARLAGERQVVCDTRLDQIERLLRERAADFAAVDRYVTHVRRTVLQATQFRPFNGAAFPLAADAALDETRAVRPGELPDEASLIGVDGSQIVPDRHAAFVYYLINIGAIIFHHGRATAPEPVAFPVLRYPEPDELNNLRFGDGAGVAVERDMAEIGRLAELAERVKQPDVPLLALMDQRLLYVPIGELGPKFKEEAIRSWQENMNRIRRAGGWLAGLIDRPGKSSVITLLRGLMPDFNPDTPDDLGEWDGLVDAELFERLLAPGERSAVFVDLSHANERFAGVSRYNEMCFFYLNTGDDGHPNIARVDLPRWVGENPAAVQAVQALLLDQCRILGRYPYILARADEIAVVGRQDQQELEVRIARMMDRHDVAAAPTAKFTSKEWVRSGKRRLDQP